ncbi:MAG: L-serine ammonia-lyase, iron-sulfur-dependent, subunit alpha [Eubacteriales bacterium]
MEYNFTTGAELLSLCHSHKLPISQVMKLREKEYSGKSFSEIDEILKIKLEIMKESAFTPLKNPQKSMGGLLGGEGKAMYESSPLCGSMLQKALAYAMAVLEVNASMGLIVAAPTAGASGVLPGVLFALAEEKNLQNNQLYEGLTTASAVGYLAMRHASVSGAEAGCQAEVGVASAMAAASVVELCGGTPPQALHAASFALSNLLGLVCDPIGGLVEAPCQTRNAIGVSNAFTSAQLAWAGIVPVIPFDEMLTVMYQVGCALPCSLRETALGGCATAPSASAFSISPQ